MKIYSITFFAGIILHTRSQEAQKEGDICIIPGGGGLFPVPPWAGACKSSTFCPHDWSSVSFSRGGPYPCEGNNKLLCCRPEDKENCHATIDGTKIEGKCYFPLKDPVLCSPFFMSLDNPDPDGKCPDGKVCCKDNNDLECKSADKTKSGHCRPAGCLPNEHDIQNEVVSMLAPAYRCGSKTPCCVG